MHERDDDDNKYESQEDGEYHFSDDQINYDLEPEVKPGATPKPAVSPALASAAAAGVSQYRRPIIGVAIFIVLIFLVYKISAPTSQTPTTDFTQNSGAITNQNPVMKQPPTAAQNTQTNSAFHPLAVATGMSGGSPAGTSVVSAPVMTTPTPTAPAPPAATTPQTPAVTSAPPAFIPEQPVVAQATALPAAGTPTPTTTAPETATPPATSGENYYNPMHPTPEPAATAAAGGDANSGDQIVALQKENARLTAEFTQKMADTQAQNDALQGKMQDLTMRLTSMESTIARLGRTLQETKVVHETAPGTVTPSVYTPPPRAAEPHMIYSVQAIIPGRAWLKSDSGETITVAEGDILKNYGRIMKIDPYDGIVQIDTGGHIMNLSYGVSTD